MAKMASAYILKERELSLDDSWDVIVVGGGPSGCTAATACARGGARTLLVEATGTLGGMATSGLVTCWCPFSDKQGNVLYGGLAERVLNATKDCSPHIPPDKLDCVSFNPEPIKRIFDDMVTSAGADVLFNTSLCGVEADSGVVSAAVFANKSGLSAYKAKVFVDCTGDGDLAAWSGAEFNKGDERTGELQPASLCFVLTNVDEYAYRFGPKLSGKEPDSPVNIIMKSGKYPQIPDKHVCNSLIGPGTVSFNAGHVWDVDNTDPVSVSAAMIEGRKMAAAFRDALAEVFPEAFSNAMLVTTAPLMGIRETRQIVGDYVLTIDDYIARRTFDDEICRNNYWIDIHTTKAEQSKARQSHDHVLNRCEDYHPGESHGIPYRCLTPKGLRNVLVAGRSISCDHAVQASVRVMPPCMVTGEAAGMAAAYAAKDSLSDVHAVDVNRLRGELKEHGAFLPDPG